MRSGRGLGSGAYAAIQTALPIAVAFYFNSQIEKVCRCDYTKTLNALSDPNPKILQAALSALFPLFFLLLLLRVGVAGRLRM